MLRVRANLRDRDLVRAERPLHLLAVDLRADVPAFALQPGAQIEARQAEARFGSYLCSIVKTTLEVALSSHARVDLFVTHPICDAARNLAGVWGRNFAFPCQILYLPQNPNSAHAAA